MTYLNVLKIQHELIHELGKFFPITIIRDFSQQIFKNIEEKNFRDHTNILYSLFRQQIDDEKDIAYVFNSPPPRDEGYWHLMVGIKETFMSKYPQNTNHALAKYLINLQKNNSAEYSSRTNLFFQIMLHSILVVFDEKFHLTKGQKFFFAELEQDKNSKVLFGLEVDK